MTDKIKFFPLIKKGFQEVADTDAIEADIDDLKQKKVTKFFSATDTLEDGEIAQYQGVDDSDNNLVNGFFYKSIYSPITIPSGTSYLEYSAESDTARLGNINYNGFIVNYGDKLFLIDDNVNVSHFRVDNNWQTSSQERYVYTPYNLNGDVQIGDKAFYWPNGSHCYFTHVFPPPVRLSDGNTLIGPMQGGASIIFNKVSKYLSSNGFYYYAVEYSAYFILLKLNSELTKVVDWQPICLNSFTTSAEIVVNIQSLVQTNSQPQTSGITEENGTLKVSMPVEFADDVTVKGTQTVVTTEQIQSEKDFIKLRYNNPLALASGDVSGISVENYDGNATNCLLAVDKDGWARIGDSTGTLEKIATIEEEPTDAQFVQYDAQNKQLKTAAIPEATTLTAGLMSAVDKLKLDSIENLIKYVLYRGEGGNGTWGNHIMNVSGIHAYKIFALADNDQYFACGIITTGNKDNKNSSVVTIFNTNSRWSYVTNVQGTIDLKYIDTHSYFVEFIQIY